MTTAAIEAAKNYGKSEALAHQQRYALAAEYLDVVRGLWDSFEEDAIIADRETEVFLNVSKLHAVKHDGPFFKVHGPLNIKRTPQGHPVMFQAGLSDDGRDFAAKYADAVFVVPRSIQEAKAFTQDLKRRARAAGRREGEILIFAGFSPVFAETAADVETLLAERAALAPIGGQLATLSALFSGYDFTSFALDEPFPSSIPERWLNGNQGRALVILETVRNEALTLRQTAHRFGTKTESFSGTFSETADEMERWIEDGACDGFILSESVPGQLKSFVEAIVPLLKDRGLMRAAVDGETLRERLGLPTPKNQFACTAAPSSDPV